MTFLRKYEYLLVATVIALVFIAAGFDCLFEYKDTDNYMRALRIIHDATLGNWEEGIFPMSNYPFGEVLHWTRLMDVLWIVMAMPFYLVMDFKDAIFYAGMYFSPVCAVGVAVALVYALRPYTTLLVRAIVLGFFFIQGTIYGILAWGRPDHHSLLLLLSIIVIGAVLRWLNKPQPKFMIIAAIACGLMTWVAAEGFLFSLVILLSLGFLWLVNTKKDYLPVIQTFLLYFLISITLFWLIDPPMQGYAFADNGRLSVVQILIVAVATLFSLALHIVNPQTIRAKIIGAVIAGIAVVVLLFLVFGWQIFISPIDGYLYEIWGKRVSELRSILSAVDFFGFGFIPLGSLIVLYYLIRKTSLDKNVLLFIGILLAVYTIMAFYAVRFGIYALTLAFFPIAFFIDVKFKESDFYENKKAPIPNSVMVFLLALFTATELCPIAAKMLTMNEEEFNNAPLFRNNEQNANLNMLMAKSDMAVLYPYLFGRKGAVLTDVFGGPKVMWMFNRPVVGTPYHRNVEGIGDTYDILFATDMDKAKKLLIKHRVTDIFLSLPCDKTYYVDPEKNLDKFYAKLYTGKSLPDWLIEVKGLNFDDKAGFVLYRVNLP